MERLIKKDLAVFFMIFLFISTFFSPVYSQNKNQNTADRNIKIFVEYKLIKDNLLKDDNINVNVKNNIVTLEGTVPTINDKREAGEEARNESGNFKVVNNISIASSDQPDSIIVEKVLHRIRRNAFYSVFNWVTAKDSSGIVTLAGWVHIPWYKKLYQKEAEKVVGVKEVVNKIQNTFGPGEAGIRAARLIYSDPTSMFNGWQYYSDPPIHIINVNGSIILAGKVPTESVEYWAVNLVSFRTNAINVINDLKVGS